MNGGTRLERLGATLGIALIVLIAVVLALGVAAAHLHPVAVGESNAKGACSEWVEAQRSYGAADAQSAMQHERKALERARVAREKDPSYAPLARAFEAYVAFAERSDRGEVPNRPESAQEADRLIDAVTVACVDL